MWVWGVDSPSVTKEKEFWATFWRYEVNLSHEESVIKVETDQIDKF